MRALVAVATVAMVAACSSQPSTTIHAGRRPPDSRSVQRASSSTAGELAARLKAVGMPVTRLTVYTAATDPNHLLGRQGGYTSKVAWVDPAAVAAGVGNPANDPGGTEYGGGIEVFSTAADARARYDYLRGFRPPFGDGYDYLFGHAILRLSNYLTPAQARAYQARFRVAVSR